jgi:hypothetical protein
MTAQRLLRTLLRPPSAASLASSSRTNGVRPVMPATASNSDREASPSSRNSKCAVMKSVGRKCLPESHERLSAQPAERCCRRRDDLLGERLHIIFKL